MSSTPKSKRTTKAAPTKKTAGKVAHSPAVAVPPADPAARAKARDEESRRMLADARERGRRARKEDPNLVEFLTIVDFRTQTHSDAHYRLYQAAKELLEFGKQDSRPGEPSRQCCVQLATIVMQAYHLGDAAEEKYAAETERLWDQL